MSAITGIFCRDGRTVFPEQIKKMNDALSHRGPDGSFVWLEGPVALGHQMLHTTPESLIEELPFEDPDSHLVITADARIDNRNELALLLGLEDIKDVPDSQFILKAYQKWHEESPDKLLGDFAFVIWDPQNKRLFCARDCMGIKPLYYYVSDGEFIFATEIKALFTISSVPQRLNELKLPFFFSYNEGTEPTFYDGICSLNKATSLTINENDIVIKKYWELDPQLQVIMDSEEDYIKKFREIFAEAIKCRLRSAFPLGFELSGGLDSSSVVCMANKILKENMAFKPMETFSMIFKGYPKGDESRYIESVIDVGGIKPNFIYGEDVSLFENVDAILWYQDQPYNAPFLAVMWKSYRKMQNKNIRVLFSGAGGDHVVSYGQNYLTELAIKLKWNRLVKEIRNFSKNKKISFWDVLKSKIVLPLIPNLLISLLRAFLDKDPIIGPMEILDQNFLNKLKDERNLESLNNITRHDHKTAKAYHYNMIQDGLDETIEMLDRLSAAHLIEPRYPYLDKRLIEFCYGIPTEMKFKSGWPRYIQRIAMEDILPHKIQWRMNKGVIGEVLQRNLIYYEKESLDQLFIKENGMIKDYINLTIMKEIYQKYKSGKNVTHVNLLWKILMLSKWLEKNNIHI